MSERAEVLWPLFGALTGLDGIGPKTAQALGQIGIETPRDLLLTLPYSGIDRRLRETIHGADLPATVTVRVTVGRHRPPSRRGGRYVIEVDDAKMRFQIVYFRGNSEYLGRLLPQGTERLVSGRVELFDGIAQMVHPDHVLDPQDASDLPDFEPVYPLTSGVTQKTMTRAMRAALARLPDLPEWNDPGQMTREDWPGWAEALHLAHAPKSAADLTPNAPARARLAYDELMAHQISLAMARRDRRAVPGVVSTGDGALRQAVLDALPYLPTGAQTHAIEQIASDMATPERMMRLLQGDVGAGKTLVAFMALLIAVEAGGQGVLMAPTSILARQHQTALLPLAEAAGVTLDLLTGRDKGSERAAKLEALVSGETQILIGTHAVFQKDVEFANLLLAVVDEQHRFGVRQRLELGRKGPAADMLVMTATPIPRSLALAQYGDMDVSILDEKPPGRKPVKTALVSLGRLDEVVTHLRNALDEGRQAYWVCPLVEESEVSDLTAAQARFERLRAVLGEERVGLVHGQMPMEERDAAMAHFAAGQTGVLVATTVIEVGVDVPNASIMVIERAETFGLAQLHQLRGRVGRGTAASTCLLLYQSPLPEAGMQRLTTLRESEDGFYLSEMDLKMRGAGDLIGTAQSGLPRFRIADLERQSALMAIAQSDARKVLNDDPNLNSPRGTAVRMLLALMRQESSHVRLGAG